MFEKMKNKVVAGRCAVVGVAVAAPVLLGSVTSFAADGADASVTALTTACSSIAGSATSGINAVIPIALPLVGVGLVIGIGLKVFKRIAAKA